MLTPRAHTVLSVLNDLKDAFLTLLRKPNKHPSLLMMYAFIDICAALANRDPRATNRQVFIAYLEEFLTPRMRRAMTPMQLWAARSALLHTFSPLGRHTGPGKAPPTFYYSHGEDKETVRNSLRARGYSDFALLSVDDIKSIAIWTFNGMISQMERNRCFHDVVVQNAEHLLLTQSAVRVEAFMQFVADTRKEGEPGEDE